MLGAFYEKLQHKLTQWLTYEFPPSETPPYDYNRLKYEIRPGDVLLIEGHSRISSIIQTVTRSPWSHAALYIGRWQDLEDRELKKIVASYFPRRENVRLIIEGMLGKGAIVTRLSHYRKHHIRICRPIGISPEDIDLVIAYMIKSLGMPYNVRQVFDLARFLLPWSLLPRRWGSSLFRTSSGEPESGICSSLLAEAFASVQFPILPLIKTEDGQIRMIQRNPHLFTPKDFDYSPYFEIIKYPLFATEEKPFYRRLPWSTKSLYHDHGVVTPIISTTTEPRKDKNFVQKLITRYRSNHHE